MTKSHGWYAARYAANHGMAIVPILPISKRPASDYWNMTADERPKFKSSKDKNGKKEKSQGPGLLIGARKVQEFYADHQEHNIGLELGKSGFCSLDIDDLDYFRELLGALGLSDKEHELNEYPTIQGSPLGKRIMFRVPKGVDLGYKKIVWPFKEDPDRSRYKALIKKANSARSEGNHELYAELIEQARSISAVTVVELRACSKGDRARYDVLPPSIHPTTQKPYRWIVQPARTREEWPEPPPWLLDIWSDLDAFKRKAEDLCPWAPKPKQRVSSDRVRRATEPIEGEGVIDRHLREVSLEDALREYGYQEKGDKWLSPFSASGEPGVTIDHGENRCYIFHASDPLCDRPVNAFDLYCEYEHKGDVGAAVKALSERYGMQTKRREFPPSIADAPPEHMDIPLPDDRVMPIEKEERKPKNKPKPKEKREVDAPTKSVTPDDSVPFRALGFDEGTYFYLPRNTEQVTQIPASAHTSHGPMLRLADLSWWTENFPRAVTKDGEHKGVDWTAAAAYCMQMCHRAGVYDESNIRGRGAWFDNGRSILHLGNRILVDGQQHKIADVDGDYIYTRMAPMEGEHVEPATDAEARQVANLFTRLHWTDKVMGGQFLAGWCALAPVCGALQWRPHIWITAQRGAGKTWVQDRLIAPLLGKTAITTLAGTTEAGLRQDLRWDARPVIYDEAESERNKTKSIMQGVLELARVSSSESSARILKGTATGRGMNYMIRSMFYLSSINVQQMQAADTSRITIVRLDTPPDTKEEVDRFAELERDTNLIITREMCAKIRARTYLLIPVIRKNAALLGAAIAKLGHGQRAGDQYGTLIAGAASLYSSKELTQEEAEKWVASVSFDQVGQFDQPSDEESCIAAIMQHHIVYDGTSRAERATIGELVEACLSRCREPVNGIPIRPARQILGRYGIRVDDDNVSIANNHKELQKILERTPWASGWKHILERMPGAEATGALRFAGSVSRAVSIPIDVVMQFEG